MRRLWQVTGDTDTAASTTTTTSNAETTTGAATTCNTAAAAGNTATASWSATTAQAAVTAATTRTTTANTWEQVQTDYETLAVRRHRRGYCLALPVRFASQRGCRYFQAQYTHTDFCSVTESYCGSADHGACLFTDACASDVYACTDARSTNVDDFSDAGAQANIISNHNSTADCNADCDSNANANPD